MLERPVKAEVEVLGLGILLVQNSAFCEVAPPWPGLCLLQGRFRAISES